jgi:hypothetical protein
MSLQSPDKAAAKASGKRGAAASNSEDTKRRRNEPRRYFNDERKPAFYLCKDCGARCSPDCAVADMMFGFGDVERPLQSTVDVVEDVVTSYLRNLVMRVLLAVQTAVSLMPNLYCRFRKPPRPRRTRSDWPQRIFSSAFATTQSSTRELWIC